MRFVRYFTHPDSGEIVVVAEQETPLDGIFFGHESIRYIPHDLGLVEDFESLSTSTGRRCSPAAHIFERIERDPGAGYRAKPGHELPVVLDCPATLEGIRQRLRERGPGGIPEREAHWLEFMGAFSPDDMDAAALPRLTLTRALEFDAVRKARDPSVGSRADYFKAEARRRIAERAGRDRA